MNVPYHFLPGAVDGKTMRSRGNSRHMRMSKATHEAAHAIAAVRLGLKIQLLVASRYAGLCVVCHGGRGQTVNRKYASKNLLIAVAPEAYFQTHHWLRHPENWYRGDDYVALSMAKIVLPGREHDARDNAKARMEKLFKLSSNSLAVRLLARRLYRKAILSRIRVEDMLKAN